MVQREYAEGEIVDFDDLPEGAVIEGEPDDFPEGALLPSGAGFVAGETVRNIGRGLRDLPGEAAKGVARVPFRAAQAAGSALEMGAEAVTGIRRRWRRLLAETPWMHFLYRNEDGTPQEPDELRAAEEWDRKLATFGAEGSAGMEGLVEWAFRPIAPDRESVAAGVGAAAEYLPAAVVAGAVGGPGAAAGVMTGLGALPEYTRFRELGVPPEEAAANTALIGLGTFVLDRAGARAAMGESPATRKLIEKMGDTWYAGAATRYAAGAGSGTLQALYQNAVAAGYDEGREVFAGAMEAGLAAGLVAAASGAPGQAARTRARAAMAEKAKDAAGQATFKADPKAQARGLIEDWADEVAGDGTDAHAAMRAAEEEGLAGARAGMQEAATSDMTEGGPALAPEPEPPKKPYDWSHAAQRPSGAQAESFKPPTLPKVEPSAPRMEAPGAEDLAPKLRELAGLEGDALARRAGEIQDALHGIVERKQLRGELETLLAELKQANHAARTQGSGKQVRVDAQGHVIGGHSVTHYREGFSGKDIPALERYLAGKKLGVDQLERVVKAVEEVRRQVFKDVTTEPVRAGSLAKGDRIEIEGETFRVTKTDGDRVHLKDGTKLTVPADQTLVIDRGSRARGKAEAAEAAETGKKAEGETKAETPAARGGEEGLDTSFDVEQLERDARPGEQVRERGPVWLTARESADTAQPIPVAPEVAAEWQAVKSQALAMRRNVSAMRRRGFDHELEDVVHAAETNGKRPIIRKPDPNPWRAKRGYTVEAQGDRVSLYGRRLNTPEDARAVLKTIAEQLADPRLKTDLETDAAWTEADKRFDDYRQAHGAVPEDVFERMNTWLNERIQQIHKEGRLGAGPDPELAALWAAKGAIRIAQGVRDFGAWAAEMVREFGEAIRPHLEGIWKRAQAQAGQWEERLRATPARPDLSQIAEDAGARQIVAKADELRGAPAQATFAETDAAAEARIRAGRETAIEAIRAGRGFGVGADVATEIRVAQKLITQEGAIALARGNLAAADRAFDMVLEYRDAMSRVGRALAEGRDRFETPEKRNFRGIVEALVTPDEVTEQAWRKAKADNDQAAMRAIQAKQRKATQEAVRALLEEEGIDLAKLTPEDLRDPLLVARIGRFFQARNATFGDKLLEYWVNSVLSGPLTHVVNITGTAANVAWHYTVQRLAESALNMAVRAKGAGTFGDLAGAYEIAGPGMMRAAWGAARLAWDTERPQLGGNATKMDVGHVAIGGLPGRVVRGFGSRLLLAADVFNKRVASELEMAEQAHRIAREEGLTGDALTRRAQELAANPTDAMIRAGEDMAGKLTFTAPGGKLVQAVNLVKTQRGWRYPMTFLFPFVRTPVQVLGTGLRKSPLGAVRLGVKALRGDYRGADAKPAMVRDVAEQIVAQALTWIALGMVTKRDEQGRRYVTGNRVPTLNAGERAMRQAHEPAQSIRIGNQWYSYARLDPFATAFAAMVDAADTVQAAGKGKAYAAVARLGDTVKGLVRDKAYLQSLGDLMRMLEPDSQTAGQKGLQWVGNFAASWVPNVVRAPVRAADKKVRDYSVRGEENVAGRWAKATAHKALPLASAGPAQKLDYWGRPVAKGNAPGSDVVWRMLVPSNVQDAPSLLNVDRLLFNWNREHEGTREEWWPSMPSIGEEVAGVYREMTAAEYETFLRRRGQLALERLGEQRLNYTRPKLADVTKVKTIVEYATKQARMEWLQGKLSSATWAADLRTESKARWQ